MTRLFLLSRYRITNGTQRINQSDVSFQRTRSNPPHRSLGTIYDYETKNNIGDSRWGRTTDPIAKPVSAAVLLPLSKTDGALEPVKLSRISDVILPDGWISIRNSSRKGGIGGIRLWTNRYCTWRLRKRSTVGEERLAGLFQGTNRTGTRRVENLSYRLATGQRPIVVHAAINPVKIGRVSMRAPLIISRFMFMTWLPSIAVRIHRFSHMPAGAEHRRRG